MIVFFKGMKHQHIFVCDIEYDNSKVIQFAGLLFKNIDYKNSLYQIQGSINIFLKQDNVSSYARRYTGIEQQFLDSVGETEQDFILSYKEMFRGTEVEDTLFVSHGSKNDRKILKTIPGIDLPQHSYCTYRNAKRILKRESKLTLTDIANEAGYFLDNAHDAFADAWATVAALSFLLKIDGEE
jgi:DNA polymerase III epsilon subunit-like protein